MTSVATQADFDSDVIITLKQKNKELEHLHYNTRFNSGKTLHDEINTVTQNDELISLRNEFKNMIHINQTLLKEHDNKHHNNNNKRSRDCCCYIL